MPYRSIDSLIDDDPFIRRLNLEQFGFFMKLVLNRRQSLSGIIEISVQNLAQELKISVELTEKMLSYLQKKHKVWRYFDYIFVKNYSKHNGVLDSPNKIIGVLKELRHYPLPLQRQWLKRYPIVESLQERHLGRVCLRVKGTLRGTLKQTSLDQYPISNIQYPRTNNQYPYKGSGGGLKKKQEELKKKWEPHPDLSSAVATYSQEINIASSVIVDELNYLLTRDKIPIGWITDAIAEAVKQEKRSFSYVKAILDRWRQFGREAPKKAGSEGAGVRGSEEFKPELELTKEEKEAARKKAAEIFEERKRKKEGAGISDEPDPYWGAK